MSTVKVCLIDLYVVASTEKFFELPSKSKDRELPKIPSLSITTYTLYEIG